MIIDTHCHYNLEPLHQNWQEHWKNAQDHEVVNSVVIGTSAETSQTALDLTAQNPLWKAAVGIHPNTQYKDEDFEKISVMATQNTVVAIGETGLDYFRLDQNADNSKIIDSQQLSLIEHIKLSNTLNLPLVIHLRDNEQAAYWDFLSIYKQHAQNNIPFILHCVSGPLEFVKEATALGAYIGVAGNVTYKNSDHIRAIVTAVSPERLLLETDAPFLPPIPHRGHISEPWMIQLSKNFLVETLSISEELLLQNTLELFPQFSKAE